MAGEWRTLTVGEIKAADERAIAIGPFGSRMKADAYVAEGVPVIRGNNISDTRGFVGDFVFVSEETADGLQACNAFAGDLVFPHRGAIGRVGVVPEDGTRRYMLSTSLMKLTCNRQLVDPLFVFYYFRSALGRNALLERASTVGTPGIGQPLSSLRSISLPIPPLPEQRAIAHILGTLDDKIELNRRMSETLEAMARALFKSWFVDFDPVRAKAEGRDPGLPEHIADLFPARLVDSELGEIPEGWEVQPLSEVCQKPQYGYTASASDEPVGPRFLRITDINKRDWIEWESVPFCSIEPEKRDKYALAPGDMVIARMADPGHGAIIEEAVDAVFASYLIRFRPQRDELARYLQYWLRSPLYWNTVRAAQSGTTRANLNAKVLGSFDLVIPPANALQPFNELADAFRRRVVANVRESTTLAALRDTLLPRLISGELRVEHAEKLIERVGT